MFTGRGAESLGWEVDVLRQGGHDGLRSHLAGGLLGIESDVEARTPLLTPCIHDLPLVVCRVLGRCTVSPISALTIGSGVVQFPLESPPPGRIGFVPQLVLQIFLTAALVGGRVLYRGVRVVHRRSVT